MRASSSSIYNLSQSAIYQLQGVEASTTCTGVNMYRAMIAVCASYDLACSAISASSPSQLVNVKIL